MHYEGCVKAELTRGGYSVFAGVRELAANRFRSWPSSEVGAGEQLEKAPYSQPHDFASAEKAHIEVAHA